MKTEILKDYKPSNIIALYIMHYIEALILIGVCADLKTLPKVIQPHWNFTEMMSLTSCMLYVSRNVRFIKNTNKIWAFFRNKKEFFFLNFTSLEPKTLTNLFVTKSKLREEWWTLIQSDSIISTFSRYSPENLCTLAIPYGPTSYQWFWSKQKNLWAGVRGLVQKADSGSGL